MKKITDETKFCIIYNSKGGIGKTSLTLLTMYELASQGCKILLIDSDAQSNATRLLSNSYDHLTLLDALQRNLELNDIVVKSPNENYPNIDLIASNREMKSISEYISTKTNREKVIAKLFRKNEDFLFSYDYVFIDLSPTLDITGRNFLLCADSIISPITHGCILSIDGLDNFYDERIEFFEDLEIEDNCKKFVFWNEKDNKYREVLKLSEQYFEKLDENIKNRLLESSISKTTIIEKSILSNLSVKDYLKSIKKSHKVETEIDNFINELRDKGAF